MYENDNPVRFIDSDGMEAEDLKWQDRKLIEPPELPVTQRNYTEGANGELLDVTPGGQSAQGSQKGKGKNGTTKANPGFDPEKMEETISIISYITLLLSLIRMTAIDRLICYLQPFIMKLLTTLAMFLMSVCSFAQSPDLLVVYAKKIMSGITDCVVEINISRKDKSNFFFPSRQTVTMPFNPSGNLILFIEKQSGKRFRHYRCKWASVHQDAWKGDTVIYETYQQLKIVDSLESIKCLSQGKYRLKVAYNERNPDGSIERPNYILSSNWLYFYVVPKEIILNRFYYGESKKKDKYN